MIKYDTNYGKEYDHYCKRNGYTVDFPSPCFGQRSSRLWSVLSWLSWVRPGGMTPAPF